MKSNEAYLAEPTIAEVQEALKTGKIYRGNDVIFAKDNLVEVRTRTGSEYTSNLYRDMYRII
jgi:hypothetical protein